MRLIDADALKAKLKIDTNTATYSDYCNGYCDARQVDLDAIDAAPTIDAEPVRHGRWIPCSERLPEQSAEGQPPNVKCSDCALVEAGGWIGMAYYVTYGEESQWEFADAQNKPKIDFVEITHWMPLPEPPKEDET